MSKTKQQSEAAKVREAIHSLYAIFETPRYGCKNARTRETVELEKKIKQRERELDKDAKLVALRKELDTVRKSAAAEATGLRRAVDDLMRRFNLRGVTEELIRDTESLAKRQPILIGDDCE